MSFLPALALLLPAAPADEVGKPAALVVQPETVVLAGPRSMQQMVVTGRYADGTERDLTPFAEWQAEAAGVVALGPHSLLADIFRAWQAEGRHDDPPDRPALVGIDVTPRARVLHAPARLQQLAVRARFADSTSADVTRLTVYSSSDPAIARADASG